MRGGVGQQIVLRSSSIPSAPSIRKRAAQQTRPNVEENARTGRRPSQARRSTSRIYFVIGLVVASGTPFCQSRFARGMYSFWGRHVSGCKGLLRDIGIEPGCFHSSCEVSVSNARKGMSSGQTFLSRRRPPVSHDKASLRISHKRNSQGNVR